MMRVDRLVMISCLLGGLLAAAEPVPYGHKDFYPSATRPLGYRADGSGCYPGATPVTTWEERTPRRGRAKKSEHVVWRTRMPGWSDTQPLVVGDRIICLTEPDIICCVDANDGRILWQDRVMPMFIGPAPDQGISISSHEAWRRQQVIDMARALTVRAGGLRSKREPWPSDEFKAQGLEGLNRLRDGLASVTTDPAILKGFDDYISAWAKALATPGAVEAPGGHLKPIMERYQVALDQVWFGVVGTVQSTPVTDGEHVYVAFGQGMIACYDLLGNRRWAWRETEFQLKGKLYCDHTPSLLLVDGVLLVRSHFGDLLGLDPQTGAVLHNTDIGPAYNHGAYTTPGVMRLTSPGGKKRTVVVTQHDKIIDPQTGAIVATFDKSGFRDIGHGQPRMVVGDKVLIHSSQTVPPDKGPAVVLRVSLADDLSVTTERVHGFDGMYFGNSPMALTVHGDLFGHLKLWNFQTGKPYPGATAPERNEGGGITIAGPFAFNCVIPRNPRNGWRESDTGCWDVGTAGTTSKVPGKRLLAFEGTPTDRDADRYLPNLDPAGKPGWFGLRNAGFSPSGNRLFAQTYGYLYAIGDPAQAYDWNPASRPVALSQALAAAKPGLGDRLASARTWDRAQAAEEFAALSAADRHAQLPALLHALPGSSGLARQTLLQAIQSLGGQAAAARDGVRQLAEQAMAAGDGDAVADALACLAAVDAKAAAELNGRAIELLVTDPRTACLALAGLGDCAELDADSLRRLAAHLQHDDDAVAIAAARALAALGARAKPVREQLIAAVPAASREVLLPVVEAALAQEAQEELCGALVKALRGKDARKALAAARACDRFAVGFSKDEISAEELIDALIHVVRKRKGEAQFAAIQAVGAYGGLARPALSALRVEANGASCPALATMAMKRIDPKASTAISPMQDDDEPELDIDLDL